jgi:hypothetical protein
MQVKTQFDAYCLDTDTYLGTITSDDPGPPDGYGHDPVRFAEAWELARRKAERRWSPMVVELARHGRKR